MVKAMKTMQSMVMASALALVGASALAQGNPGAGRGPMTQAGADDTPGWSMMTRTERNTHRDQMRAMKTYDECTAYMAQHHEQMMARAKEKGGKPLAAPRRDACASLKGAQ